MGLTAFIVASVFCTLIIGSGIITATTANISSGLYVISFGLFLLAISLWLFIAKHIAIKKTKENFDRCLQEAKFSISNTIGDFLMDADKKLWCKRWLPVVFLFSDIIDATIHKNAKNITTNDYYGSGYTRNSGYRTSHGHSTSYSTDQSTYSVFVRTKNLQFSIVEFPCGHSEKDAEKIRSAIELILNDLQPEEKPQIIPEKQSDELCERLKKLKNLLDEGILSQEEFEQKKKHLLEF